MAKATGVDEWGTTLDEGVVYILLTKLRLTPILPSTDSFIRCSPHTTIRTTTYELLLPEASSGSRRR